MQIGFFGLLFLIFLVLKLTGYIAWSWWIVTIPLWGPTLALMVLLAMGIAAGGTLEIRRKSENPMAPKSQERP
ncbi:MAG: hypothetical protein ACYCY2_03345 [Acidithiobacillus ferriphilus]